MLESLLIFILVLYVLYIVFEVLAGALALWGASQALDFQHKSFKKALRLVVFYVVIIALPLLFIFFAVASNTDIRLDESAVYPFVLVIILMHLMFLFMLKNAYDEKWAKILLAYLCYSVTIFCLSLVLMSFTLMLGLAFWDSNMISFRVDWSSIYEFIRGIGRIDVPK